jgi:acetoin utilization protein AcuB
MRVAVLPGKVFRAPFAGGTRRRCVIDPRMSELPKIRDFMTSMPGTIDADRTLEQAREVMFRFNARHLPVLRDDKLVGIISQRDIAIAESLGRLGNAHTVEDAMSSPAFTCGPEAHLHAVATEMAEHKYGTAVVVEREHPLHVIGLFTTVDALRALALFTGHGG